MRINLGENDGCGEPENNKDILEDWESSLFESENENNPVKTRNLVKSFIIAAGLAAEQKVREEYKDKMNKKLDELIVTTNGISTSYLVIKEIKKLIEEKWNT